MLHVGFIDQCRKILKCVCFRCYKLLGDESEPRFKNASKVKDPRKRLAAVLKLCSTIKKCRTHEDKKKEDQDEGLGFSEEKREGGHNGCGEIQPKFTISGLNILIEFEKVPEQEHDKKRTLAPEELLRIFKGISDDDARILGFDPGNRFTNF